MEFEDPDTAGHVGDVRSADRIYVSSGAGSPRLGITTS
jgi:hypothetical protein